MMSADGLIDFLGGVPKTGSKKELGNFHAHPPSESEPPVPIDFGPAPEDNMAYKLRQVLHVVFRGGMDFGTWGFIPGENGDSESSLAFYTVPVKTSGRAL
jgi:hypothetical protein